MKGIGASYDRVDMTDQFIAASVACLGWTEAEATDFHARLRRLENGEVIYIKSHPQGRLYIKAVGIVIDNTVTNYGPVLGAGVAVRWIYTGPMVRVPYLPNERVNDRSNSIFTEDNARIQAIVTGLLIQGIDAKGGSPYHAPDGQGIPATEATR